MPYIKPIPGHTTLGAAQRYLECDGRALARDFINLEPQIIGLTDNGEPVYGAYDWASTMDAPKTTMGNDTPYRGRRARTYKHYVLPPDLRDGIGLSEIRSVTMSWVYSLTHTPSRQITGSRLGLTPSSYEFLTEAVDFTSSESNALTAQM